jgi:hypothetical protein
MTMMRYLERGRVSPQPLPTGTGKAAGYLIDFSTPTDCYSSTERLIELLREFPPEEPSRKRFITEMIGWSSRFGPLERGDPELHHAVGSVFAEGILILVERFI